MDYSDDPLFKHSTEECRKMTREEYCALVEEHNKFVRKKHSQINEEVPPKFNTIEELRAYYKCIPLEEAINKLDKLFND